MSRTWDNWNRYQDNSRQPLHGCIQFMVKDGNTAAPIFDVDGTALDNPILTDEYGRTEHQVCINQDVTVYFYKYIGQGRWTDELDIDTSDVSKWSLQYTAESLADGGMNSSAESIFAVDTIASLRALEVESLPSVNGKKVITLLGYNSLGDKEPINYVWNANSTAADDGGSVIKNDDLITGRWIMVQPTEHCDSRHFGVFPLNSYNAADQTYGITKLFSYCNTHSIRPFFNGSADYRWFKYSNLNVSAAVIDVSEGTRFYDGGTNNTISGEWNGDPLFYNKLTNVNAKNVKASWHAKTYTNAKNVIIDEITEQKNWQDAHIDVQVTPLFGYNFIHCSFEENRNIGSDNINGIHNTFNDCKLNERMFILSGDYTVGLTNQCVNCQVDPDDFVNSIWLYKQIRCTSDANPFFDYRDYANVGKPYENYVGNKIISNTIAVNNLKNYTGSKVVIDKLENQTAIVFENTTGWYEIPAGLTVQIKDSTVRLDLASAVDIMVNNSNVELVSMPDTSTASGDEFAVSMTLRDSTLTGVAAVYNNFTSYNSIISAEVISKNTVIKDSQINSQLSLITHNGPGITVQYTGGYNDATTYTKEVTKFISGFIDNNIFNAQLVIDGQWGNQIIAEHSVHPYNTEEALVRGLVITNNVSNVADAWKIWPLQGAWARDNLHQYVFKNNVGGFECSTTVEATVSTSQDSTPAMLKEDTSHHVIGALSYSPEYVEQVMHSTVYIDDGTSYFTTMKLFTIGTRDVSVDVEISLNGDGVNAPTSGGAVSGGIAHLTDACTVPYYNTSSTKFILASIRNLNQMVDTSFDPIFNPVNEFNWTPYFQIRNFVIGWADLANNSSVTVTFKQKN